MDFMPNKETIRIYKNTKKTCVCEKYKSLGKERGSVQNVGCHQFVSTFNINIKLTRGMAPTENVNLN